METRNQHLNLICDIGDLTAILKESVDIEIFLQRTVNLVARHLTADVCSIYLYDEGSDELVLRATIGLNEESVNQVRMKMGEGLVGKTLEKLQPICEARGCLSPDFLYFEETAEEQFESFMAVPIRRGIERIGVLVVQHRTPGYFDDSDVMALRAAASQMAGAVENARLMMDLNQLGGKPREVEKLAGSEFIKASPASGGIAFASAAVLKKSHLGLETGSREPRKKYTLKDFFVALEQTSHQLEELQSRLSERLPESASLIFTAHFMILKDAKFIEKIVGKIVAGQFVPDAVRDAARQYMEIFLSSSHAYIREKANDMEDLAGRILKNLHRITVGEEEISEERIVICRELFPSEMLKLASEDVKGIIMVAGGITSHVAILSRSMKIPLVIVQRPDLLNLPEGVPILLDADIGNIFIRPSKKVIEQFETRNETEKQATPLAEAMLDHTYTSDGHRVHLLANINLLSELSLARELKAEGIGLYRTEFPFLVRNNFPSEEEQLMVYKHLFEVMEGKPVTIRTLDVGGDKALVYSDLAPEANPELGLRSIRFSLNNRDIFEQQIRAILRAAPPSEELKIMFPMISSVDEFFEARGFVDECIEMLKKQGLEHHSKPQVGMMLEIPSVLETMDEFAGEADFFSIGTNDFVQYMLAVDRTNLKVAEYFRPHHPSVLRALAKMARAATSAGKQISVCGEMAHEPEYIPFLLGIGICHLSVDPQYLARVQRLISELDMENARKHARKLLAQSTIGAVQKLLGNYSSGSKFSR